MSVKVKNAETKETAPTPPKEKIPTYKIKPSSGEYIKPYELIDIKETEPLKLTDKRIYNSLISNAWSCITDDKEHVISKEILRGSMTGNDRLTDTINRLMKTVVLINIIDETGEKARQKFQLLSGTIEQDKSDGVFRYKFPVELRNVIKNSNVWAKLQKEVAFSFNSKYSLELYELVQTKRNLNFKNKEIYQLEELRDILGVPSGKITRFCDFNRDVLKKSAGEVNKFSDIDVAFVPLKKGKVVVAVELWWKDKDLEEVKKAFSAVKAQEYNRSRSRNDQALPIYEAISGFIDSKKLKQGVDFLKNEIELLKEQQYKVG